MGGRLFLFQATRKHKNLPANLVGRLCFHGSQHLKPQQLRTALGQESQSWVLSITEG
ncbi:hypothetical protein CLV36_11521 [Laceyella sediminis]|jgi:hypothetical protein|uniref:Uncharacterized protein n=1 Tax=Laceyella sediminis TaxID=573074 RepID=A0ABX5EMY1_9BACL|nr:hypothetical protein CLV36_11521 [Laceyella sediminis]